MALEGAVLHAAEVFISQKVFIVFIRQLVLVRQLIHRKCLSVYFFYYISDIKRIRGRICAGMDFL